MSRDITSLIITDDERKIREQFVPETPVLFICYGRDITEYPLHGIQTFGRKTEDKNPDISVRFDFVSRDHGRFITSADGITSYRAANTTNGIQYKGRFLKERTNIILRDGDELMIPASKNDLKDCVVLVYANSGPRKKIWRDLKNNSRDLLTGMCNRESFINWWQQYSAYDLFSQASLFILDIDNFKAINDLKGHNIGDLAIKCTAEVLRKSAIFENQVCRWGGDEFVGIIPGNENTVIHTLKNISEEIKYLSSQTEFPITVSIGFTDVHNAESIFDVESLLSMADKALYYSKSRGKDTVSQYKN